MRGETLTDIARMLTLCRHDRSVPRAPLVEWHDRKEQARLSTWHDVRRARARSYGAGPLIVVLRKRRENVSSCASQRDERPLHKPGLCAAPAGRSQGLVRNWRKPILRMSRRATANDGSQLTLTAKLNSICARNHAREIGIFDRFYLRPVTQLHTACVVERPA